MIATFLILGEIGHIETVEVDLIFAICYCYLMSLCETIRINYPLKINRYLQILEQEYGAREHPSQPGAFLIGDPELPFHCPKQADGYVYMIGFNLVPLSHQLIQALIEYPEIAPDEASILWTQEQEILLEEMLGDMRKG